MSPHDEQTRVLIVRLGAMGDILHALPAVAALRQAHPKWYLGWAVEPRWRALLVRTTADALVNRIHLVKAKDLGSFSAAARDTAGDRCFASRNYGLSATTSASICRAQFVRLSPDGWPGLRG